MILSALEVHRDEDQRQHRAAGRAESGRDNGNQPDLSRANKPPAGQKLKRRDATRIAAWRWLAEQSGNPSGWPKHDLAAEIAKACFEENAEALYKAFSKALLKGNAYAFKEQSDRVYGRLKERIEVEAGPLRHMTDDELEQRAAALQRQLGLAPATRIAELERQLGQARALPPAEDGSKVN